MRKLQQMIITGAVFGGIALSGMGAAQAGGMSPDESLKDLMSGNVSFQRSETLAKRRAAVAQSQAPQAIIVSCSDSRVPPEAVFNRYVGRLFIVRTAGHALGDYEMASIEYAVEHLHTPLLIVLGHERCGAIKATVDALTAGGGGGDAHGDGHAAPAGKHHRAEVTSSGTNAGACAGKHDAHDDAHDAPKAKAKAKAEPEPAKAARRRLPTAPGTTTSARSSRTSRSPFSSPSTTNRRTPSTPRCTRTCCGPPIASSRSRASSARPYRRAP
jgi:hypothetical protein